MRFPTSYILHGNEVEEYDRAWSLLEHSYDIVLSSFPAKEEDKKAMEDLYEPLKAKQKFKDTE